MIVINPLLADSPLDLAGLCARLQDRAARIEQLQREQDADLRDVLRQLERAEQARAHSPGSLRLLSMTELEDLTGISRTTLYKLAESGELPATKIGGSWRISVGEYRAWVGGQTA